MSSGLGDRVFLLEYSRGKEIQTYGSVDQMRSPTGVAVDSDDNVYVASYHRLQKFSRDGHLIKCVGQEGRKDRKLDHPRGVRLYNDHIYVCDRGNDCIQIFDTNLTFRDIIGARGQFDAPYDLDFDTEGNAYIIQRNNHQIQVIDSSGQFVRQFGQEEGEGKLKDPTAVHVMGQFVYVSDLGTTIRSLCIRSQVSLSPHLGDMVRERENWIVHVALHQTKQALFM